MATVNLSRMTVEELMDLRRRVEETLHKRRAELQTQLARMVPWLAAQGLSSEAVEAH